MANNVHKKLDANLEIIKQELGVGVTFDVLIREFNAADRKAAIIFIDGFIKDRETTVVMKTLMQIPKGSLAINGLEKILTNHLPYFELEATDNLEDAIDQMLAGPLILLVDGI